LGTSRLRPCKSRRRTADRAHGGDEMPSGHPRDLGGNVGQAGHRKMAEDAVEAQRDVNRRVGFRQGGGEIGDVKSEIDARPSG
jgi:hypothetical protein